MPGMRDVEELINLIEPAWPELEAEVLACEGAEVLAVDPEAGRRCLHALQVTTRSRLGAVAMHCGGLVFDHGWLRVYGGGCPERGLPGVAEINGFTGENQDAPAGLVVGHDVLGGLFELTNRGELRYFAPDTLEWEELGFGYGVWLSWLASGATAQFYESLRWPDWQEEAAALRLDQGLTVYPFLCTKEARQDMAATTRSAAPIDQVIGFQADLAGQLVEVPDGGTFVVRVTE
jgi:hypothetical protein